MVFVDAQNMYKRARECFFDPKTAFHTKGQFDPIALAELVCANTPLGQEGADRVFSQVRVYSGRPSPRDKSYGPHMRQCAAWEAKGVIVIARSLRYTPAWPQNGIAPQEKGIDVALAIDFVTLAVEDQYDIGVMMSIDSDLLPAVEYVTKHTRKRVEVAAWWNPARPRSLAADHVWCHRLGRAEYDLIADDVDYNIGRK